MEVTGKRNIFSTPKTRAWKRDRAAALKEDRVGPAVKVTAIAAALIASGFIEKIYIPL